MLLVVEKACAVVLFGEAFEDAVFVLFDAVVDVACDAYVEGASVAAHDVGVAGLHSFLPSDLRWKRLSDRGDVCGFGVLRLRCASLRMTKIFVLEKVIEQQHKV